MEIRLDLEAASKPLQLGEIAQKEEYEGVAVRVSFRGVTTTLVTTTTYHR